MRNRLVCVLLVLLCAAPVMAQEPDEPKRDRNLVEILIGAGALVAGTAVAAKSSQTTTITSALGQSETSTFSTSQLVTGLAIAGTGGILLWHGLRSQDRTRPATVIGIAVGKSSGSVMLRRDW